MFDIREICAPAQTIAISGHERPDGDCVGATLALYNYLKKLYPEKTIRLFLNPPSKVFSFMKGFDEIITEPDRESYDLFFALDLGERRRLGSNMPLFDNAKDTACIDHHVTNTSFAKHDHIVPDASSTCELVYLMLDEELIDREIAECIYTGLAHDTGVFQYSCTSRQTMEIAGKLMDYGFDHAKIIHETYFEKSYRQTLILGRALLESILIMEKRVIVSVIRKRAMEFYGVGPKDFEGIVNQLRNTRDTDCAIFMYEIGPQEYKVSLRSNEKIDVSKVAAAFGGGGHIRAAGLTMSGSYYDVVNNIAEEIAKQYV